jgi:8-oxo-dGTP diphosphatase
MYMKIVVAGIIKNRSGLILLVRRGPEESLRGYWEFPGGKVELGETEETCLVRELKEELGIDIEVGRFLDQNHYVYDHGEFLLKTFEVLIVGGEIGLSVHDKLVWVNPDELNTYNLAPADMPIAQLLAAKSVL